MLVVGLTGGIGSGKSTVAQLFADLGAPIIDTDQLARDVVKPGTKALSEIAKHFGDNVISDDGSLNRKKCRQLVFEDNSKRLWLEQLLHPLIRAETQKQLKELQTPYCIVVIPLLAENHPYPNIDRVLVVDISEENALLRASQRDQSSPDQIKAIMHSQATREQRLAIADDIIDNNTNQSNLAIKVSTLHALYIKL